VSLKRSDLPGRPYLFPDRGVALFVLACFWCGCPDHYRTPLSNSGFWDVKVRRNRRQLEADQAHVRGLGWTVVVAWEHEAGETARTISESETRAWSLPYRLAG